VPVFSQYESSVKRISFFMKDCLKIAVRIILGLFLFISQVRAQNSGKLWNSPLQIVSQPQGRFSFVIIGDRTGAGPDSWGIFDRAVADVNRLKPDFAVDIGDVIEGASDPQMIHNQWNEAMHHLDLLRVPLFLVPGNHDIFDPNSYTTWKELFGSTFQEFDYGGDKFILLNTEERFSGWQPPVGDPRSAVSDRDSAFENQRSEVRSQRSGSASRDSGFGIEQLSFIEQAIQNCPMVRRVFVFMHQPVWLFSGDLKNQWMTEETKLGGVSCSVFAGHLHLLAEEWRNGRRYCIVGPTGARLRFSANPTLGLLQHFTHITVMGDSVRVEFIASERTYPEATAVEAFEAGLKGFLLLRGKREGF
jgi:hypothetical protein